MPGSDILGSKGQSIQEVASGGLGTAGAPAGGVMTVQGGGALSTPLNIATYIVGTDNTGDYQAQLVTFNAIPRNLAIDPFIFNGASWDRQRTPAIFKPLSAVLITGETTIWTPTAGKKFRLMGYVITQGVATGAITLKDNTAGATILVIPQNTIGVVQISPSLGNGILSAAANNVLTATGVATETITGYVFGTEE